VADALLLGANLIYATSYITTRVALDAVPPMTLALLRLGLGALVLLPFLRGAAVARGFRLDRWRIAGMGVVGFAGAFALGNWGLARSTATNAALLIVSEPLTLLLLGPVLLGEALSGRERLGAACAVAGALLVVVNGVPGLDAAVVPHWRGDVLLLLSGVGYGAYSLLARPVLARHRALPVTVGSVLWGLPVLAPLAAVEWLDGRRPSWTPAAALATLFLGVVITGLGCLAWNWALERVTAARAGIFLNVQPVAGALLGVGVLGEPVTAFTVLGGLLVVTGLVLTVRRPASGAVYSNT
jgi:drug/metabolite transporter (DMT)-like permease